MLWVEVLNRALDWSDGERLRGWLRQVGMECDLESREHEVLCRDVAALRAVFAASYLRRPLSGEEERALCRWVDDLQLRPAAAERLAGFDLPPLRARRREALLPEPLETLLGTALVQLLGLGGAKLAEAGVGRCHGVRRAAATVSTFSVGDEARCAARAGLAELLRDGDLSQCPRLVLSPRRGQYCSKACSNAAFAARKQAREPRYFAAKQDRYRRRRQKVERPPTPGAFVYID